MFEYDLKQKMHNRDDQYYGNREYCEKELR
jgi:hypothetical protein